MGRIQKTEAVAIIESARLIPLFYHPDPDLGCRIADALFAGGSAILEFTNRGDGALDAFRTLARHVKAKGPAALIGAGSIHDAETAQEFLAAGADFIVGAALHPEIAALCMREDVLYIPGCATATEIMHAAGAGCALIKLFPADTLGGPSFLRAMRGPFPWLRAVPSGGVKATRESLKGWYDAGAAAVCMGSDLISAHVLKERDYAALEEAAAKTVGIIRDL